MRSSVPDSSLRLAICRGIHRADRGCIWAENRPTDGAACVGWMPLARAEPLARADM
jgi:light-regulated signal transduction histidine kinase (bacteriophytochrome)